jgi:hypothetical protein
MLWALDHSANRVCVRIHRALNAVTGWSNFKMARAAIHTGTSIALVDHVRYRDSGILGGLLFSSGIIITVIFWRLTVLGIRKLERTWTSEGGITQVPFSIQEVSSIMRMRVLLFYWGAAVFITEAVVVHIPWPNGSLLQGMSLYFAFQWMPPRKSVFRKAFDSAKEAASRIPSLLPSPTPIPVPS